MKRNYFVDTNVIIDLLADRKPFSAAAANLFEAAAQKKVKLYVSAISFNNIYYVLRQSLTHQKSIRLLQELSEFVETISINAAVIDKAIQSGFNDFEDAIQYHSALSNSQIDAIVTRNRKDFKKSKLSVLTPDEAVSY